jgi:hypothetical protein
MTLITARTKPNYVHAQLCDKQHEQKLTGRNFTLVAFQEDKPEKTETKSVEETA